MKKVAEAVIAGAQKMVTGAGAGRSGSGTAVGSAAGQTPTYAPPAPASLRHLL